LIDLKKGTMGLLVVVVFSSILSAIPVNACFFGKTSLEVWKVITDVEDGDTTVTIIGTIYIQNDVTNRAGIRWIKDYVQAKAKHQPWAQIGGLHIDEWWVEIPPGETYELEFDITFHKGDYKAYRNVVEVCLYHEPLGYDRYFQYRAEIEF